MSYFYFNQNNFYLRRIYYYFFEEALALFSISYLKEYKILDNALAFFSDVCIINRNLIIRNLDKFYYLLQEDSEINNFILAKLNENRTSKDKELLASIAYCDRWLKRKKDYSEQVTKNGSKFGEELQLNHKMINKDSSLTNNKKGDNKFVQKITKHNNSISGLSNNIVSNNKLKSNKVDK